MVPGHERGDRCRQRVSFGYLSACDIQTGYVSRRSPSFFAALLSYRVFVVFSTGAGEPR